MTMSLVPEYPIDLGPYLKGNTLAAHVALGVALLFTLLFYFYCWAKGRKDAFVRGRKDAFVRGRKDAFVRGIPLVVFVSYLTFWGTLKLLSHLGALPDVLAMEMLTVHGPFPPDGAIAVKYTCDGADVSPALQWGGQPEKTRSFAVLCVDGDAPGGNFIHWVVYNLPPGRSQLTEGVPRTPQLSSGGMQGSNDFGRIGYGGPCPPPGKPHHYQFRVYALNAKLMLKTGARASDLTRSMQGHIIAQGKLVGIFGR